MNFKTVAAVNTQYYTSSVLNLLDQEGNLAQLRAELPTAHNGKWLPVRNCQNGCSKLTTGSPWSVHGEGDPTTDLIVVLSSPKPPINQSTCLSPVHYIIS